MCGIAGFVAEGWDDVVLLDRLRLMVNVQRHWGDLKIFVFIVPNRSRCYQIHL
jgi:hypothetical protein